MSNIKKDAERQINQAYDFIIIGTGIAGLYTALSLDKHYNIMLVTKDKLYESNSNYAQGGIAAALDESDFEHHIQDTLKAGSHYNDEYAVNTVIKEARENIQRLIDFGVNFDKKSDGSLRKTKEGGHSTSRVLHYKDSTGEEIIRALTEQVKKASHIDIFEYTFATDLIKDHDQVIGVDFIDEEKKFSAYASKVIIASGGIGKLYENSTNALIATGDGIAMAIGAGAKVMDMEFIQFHPTALNINERRNFLISEALRGEGAVLRNDRHERFMEKYHPQMELAPRDIVSQGIFMEMHARNISGVYLDITAKDSDYVKERFPQIYKHCLGLGIDITKEYIPVVPVEHYLMGGIEVNLWGETSLENLFACGEVARTGVHGANRLASNSLLEAIVLGYRIATKLNSTIPVQSNHGIQAIVSRKNTTSDHLNDYEEIINSIRKTMSRHAFIVRHLEDLERAYDHVCTLSNQLKKGDSIKYYETRNMLRVAKCILKSAMDRKESLGSHKIIKR